MHDTRDYERGPQVRQRRALAGITQQALARALRLSQPTLCLYEGGAREMPEDDCRRAHEYIIAEARRRWVAVRDYEVAA